MSTTLHRVQSALLMTATIVLLLIGTLLCFIGFGSWEVKQPHVATRDFGFVSQLIDRDTLDGVEIRTIDFVCPGDSSRRYSFNQIGPRDFFIQDCQGAVTEMSSPWWFRYAYGNAPPLAFPEPDTDQVAWDEEA